jgi:hypothetical protein
MKRNSYIDLLMAEWGFDKQSPRLKARMSRVLGELVPEALGILRGNPKLQVEFVSADSFDIWAYFPVHRRRTIVRSLQVKLKPMARVLLVIGHDPVERHIRDHIGHVLLYLRSPRASNECGDAMREWNAARAK